MRQEDGENNQVERFPGAKTAPFLLGANKELTVHERFYTTSNAKGRGL
jgi:hypothetical protein